MKWWKQKNNVLMIKTTMNMSQTNRLVIILREEKCALAYCTRTAQQYNKLDGYKEWRVISSQLATFTWLRR